MIEQVVTFAAALGVLMVLAVGPRRSPWLLVAAAVIATGAFTVVTELWTFSAVPAGIVALRLNRTGRRKAVRGKEPELPVDQETLGELGIELEQGRGQRVQYARRGER